MGVHQRCFIPCLASQPGAFCASELRSACLALLPPCRHWQKMGVPVLAGQGKMETIYTATAFLVRSPSPVGRPRWQEKPLPEQDLTNQRQAAHQMPAQEGRSLAASGRGRGDPCPQAASAASASCSGLSCLPFSPYSAAGFLLAGCLGEQQSVFLRSMLRDVALQVAFRGW